MDKLAEVNRIEKEAAEARLSPAKLCERAQIATTTWWRIRKRPESMTLDTLAKLEAAIKARRVELEKA